MRRRRGRAAVVALLAGMFAGSVGLAEPPANVSRVLRTIDFEERALGNVEDLPMHWVKVQGPGLPHYVNGKLTTQKSHSGSHSFQMDLNGGSALYRYEGKQTPVRLGAHYRVSALVKTTPMSIARARLTAYLTDADGHLLPGTVRHSELYSAARADEPWKRLSVELTASSREAAFLVVEIGLLQPAIYDATTLGQRALHTQNIYGSAWFDDITIAQVPRVRLSTDRPGNIFARGEPARLRVEVNDRFTQDLGAQLVIRDATERVVFQRTGAIDISNAAGSATDKMAWVALPELPAGWYEASLVMTSSGQYVGEQSLALVLLADEEAVIRPDPRFGVIATDLPFAGWAELPRLLPQLGAGRVKLAVWSAEGDIQKVNSAGFDRLLEELQSLGITPTACLVDLPPELRGNDESASWADLLKMPVEQWRPQLAFLLSRHANHLDRWQLGSDGSDAFVIDPAMRKVYQVLYREFADLVQKPDLAMPWPAWYELEGELPATVALAVPPSVLPGQLALYMQDLSRSEGHHLSLSLQLLDRQNYGRETQVRDLAQRVICALAAGAERIDVPLPYSVTTQGEQLIKQPSEMLMIVRTLTRMLGGTRCRGRLPLGEGIEAYLFERDGQGMVALWDRGAAGGSRKLALSLGQHPVCVDLWGNPTPLKEHNGQVELAVGPTPIFLVGIDGPLAQLRASVGLDRPLVESSFQAHARRLQFTNPYRIAISGMVKLKAPDGWVLNPPTFSFTVNPGEKFDREVTIEFPYNSFAGTKTIEAEFLVQTDQQSRLTVPIELKLGLSDVGMQTMALRDGRDVVVQQVISNYGDRPIDYSAFAVFPGQARQERLVTNLGPGRSTIKRYRFTDVSTAVAKVRSGVKELAGTRILNEEVEVQ